MKTYSVSISYSITNDGTNITSGTLTIRRKASDEATAISVASALFGRLSNYYFETLSGKVPCLKINGVTAPEV